MSIQDLILAGVEYDTNGGCWLWAGSREVSLRGKVTVAPNKQVLAYRASYEAFVGEIPQGLMVCHKCDVPACVRPDHLFVGTAKDNVSDMIAKGRRKQGDMPNGERHRLSKLDADAVLAIRALQGKFGDRRVADHFGLRSRNTVPAIWHRKTWHHLPDQKPTGRAKILFDEAVQSLSKLPPKLKLSAEDVAYIRAVYRPRHPEFGAHALGEKFGISHSNISMVVTGKTWGAANGVQFHDQAAEAAQCQNASTFRPRKKSTPRPTRLCCVHFWTRSPFRLRRSRPNWSSTALATTTGMRALAEP